MNKPKSIASLKHSFERQLRRKRKLMKFNVIIWSHECNMNGKRENCQMDLRYWIEVHDAKKVSCGRHLFVNWIKLISWGFNDGHFDKIPKQIVCGACNKIAFHFVYTISFRFPFRSKYISYFYRWLLRTFFSLTFTALTTTCHTHAKTFFFLRNDKHFSAWNRVNI